MGMYDQKYNERNISIVCENSGIAETRTPKYDWPRNLIGIMALIAL